MKRQSKFVLVPRIPTRAMLRGATEATFLTDGSELEMHRRWNGFLENRPAPRKRKRK